LPKPIVAGSVDDPFDERIAALDLALCEVQAEELLDERITW
jgi:hypothetical protein